MVQLRNRAFGERRNPIDALCLDALEDRLAFKRSYPGMQSVIVADRMALPWDAGMLNKAEFDAATKRNLTA